jgi:hypothetical protein
MLRINFYGDRTRWETNLHLQLNLDDAKGAALRREGEPGLGVIRVNREGGRVGDGGVHNHFGIQASGAIFPPVITTEMQDVMIRDKKF